jgi:membrane associated rhomboid family serine protease
MTTPVPPGPGEPDPVTAPAGSEDVLTCYRHPGRETGVRCARCERPICPQCMVPAAVGFQCPECVTAGRRSIRAPRTVYGGRVGGGLDATRVLIAINVVVFLATLSSGASVITGAGTSAVYAKFALVPAAVADGQWWRLVTSMFLHFGLPHIALNMLALWVIGTQVEAMLGRLRFLALYFLAGIGGGLLSFAAGPVLEVAAGASGAIFGLFGALYVLARRRGLETGGIVGIIALNLVFSFTFSNIDWRGHVGGLVTGIVVAAVLAYSPAGPARDRAQALGTGVVALVLAAIGVLAAGHVHDRCPHVVITQYGDNTQVLCRP